MQELDDLLAAIPTYNEAESYYFNTVEETFTSSRLRSLLQTTADRFRLNYAATPVDVLTERTIINGVSCPEQQVRDTLQDLWEANRLGIVAKDLHHLAFLFGDAYLIAWPGDDNSLQVFAHDPRSVRVYYDVEDPMKKKSAIHTWVGDDEHLYVTLYTPETATILRSEQPADALDVANSTFTTIQSTPNPVPGIIPVFHFSNATPYGRPEHADAYGPQDMINKITITMMASIDHAGFPQRYVLTDSGLSAGVNSDFSDTAESQPEFDSSPGTTWLLSGSTLKVGQFQTADSKNFLAPIESLVRQMSAITDTPLHYFDMSGEPPSGVALRAADFPLTKKAEDRQARFAVTWREFHEFVISYYGIQPAETSVLWQPPGIVEDTEFWNTQLMKQQLGVPKDQLLREGGYTDAMIEEFMLSSQQSPGDSTPQEGMNNGNGPDGSADGTGVPPADDGNSPNA